MTRLALAFLFALAAAAPAGAVRTIEPVEGVYEFSLADLVLPTATSGRLRVRACATCTQIALQVNASTEYSFGGGKPLSFADFQTAVTQLQQQAGARATGVVFYSLATKRVTRVNLRRVK
jgi:hypothetical protein